MIPRIFQEPPLDVRSFEEVHQYFVQPFRDSRTRQDLWDSLIKLTGYIKKYDYLECIDIMYLDGEFVSQDSNPDYLNVFILFNYNLISTLKDIKEFLEWKDDLSKILETLFSGIKLVTSFSQIDESNPQLSDMSKVCTDLTSRNLHYFTKVPNNPSLTKTYLILENFET